MMSRSDYVLIAKVINETFIQGGPIVRATCMIITDNLADELENDNAQFDRDRFIAACLKEND